MELFVRDRGEGRIGQSPLADTRRLFEISSLHVVAVEIEEIQKGIFVKLVLDVSINHLVEEALGLRPVSQSFQQASASELAANLHPNPRGCEKEWGATP